jgi:arylamine N-acetyltransferase
MGIVMTDMQSLLKKYFEILRVDPKTKAVDLKTAKELLSMHCQAFAFSTLLINLRRDIIFSEFDLIKVLYEQRAGLCFHHNAALAAALKFLGFDVHYVKCLVRNPIEPNVDLEQATHLAIILIFEERRYLIDPGWGDALNMLIPMDTEHASESNGYQCVVDTTTQRLMIKKGNKVLYSFVDEAVELSYFNSTTRYLLSDRYPFYTFFIYTIERGGYQIRLFANETGVRKHIACLQNPLIAAAADLEPDEIMEVLSEVPFSAKSDFLLQFNTYPISNPKLAQMITGKDMQTTVSSCDLATFTPSENSDSSDDTGKNENLRHGNITLKKF